MADAVTWELRASNGTVIVVTDVAMSREVHEVWCPDGDNPMGGHFVREAQGPIRITAVIAGTESR